MNPFDFTGRRVLVTGASHGIGFAVASAFADAGAELAILSSTADIHDAGARIEAASGRKVEALVCDITDRAAVRRTVGRLARLDVLVNNAGLELITPILEPGEEVERTFVRIIEINVVGTWYVTREAVPLMGSGSSIVLTSSVWGKTGAAGFSAYVASKHAFALLLVAPGLVVLLLTTTFPLLYLIWSSFQQINLAMPWLTGFVGLANYGRC